MNENINIEELWQNHRIMRADDTRSALVGYYLPNVVEIGKRFVASYGSRVNIDMDTLMAPSIWKIWDFIEDHLDGTGVPPESELTRSVRRTMIREIRKIYK